MTVEEGQNRIRINLNEGDEEDLQFVKRIASGDALFGGQFPRATPCG